MTLPSAGKNRRIEVIRRVRTPVSIISPANPPPPALPSALTFAQVWACYRRYEELLPALPAACPTTRVSGIGELVDDFDAFVFDAYGVLNRGHQPIAGAAGEFAAVVATSSPVVVLTNDASGNREAVLAKHAARGFDLSQTTVIAGLDVLPGRLDALQATPSFGYLGPSPRPHAEQLRHMADASEPECDFDALTGFVLLEHPRWDARLQARLLTSLSKHPRPVLVGNPDITAPVGDRFSVEPGYLALQLALRAGIKPQLLGKPSFDVYDLVKAALTGIEPHRVLAVGDTLHTDILGARHAGFATLLVESGLLRGRQSRCYINASGIHPDFVALTL